MSSSLQPRSLAPGAALAAGVQVVAAVTAALATVIVARLLGPDGIGAYAVACAFLLLLTTFGTLGLESGIAYRVSSGLWSPRQAWVETQLAALLLGFAGAGIGIGAALLVPSAFHGVPLSLLVVLSFALPFVLSWVYAAVVALASDRYEVALVPSLVVALTTLAGVGVLGRAFGLGGAVAALALANVAAALVGTVTIPRRLPTGSGAARGLCAAGAFGFRTYAANALQFLSYRLDLFVLNAVAAGSVVGRYSVAVAVTSVVWLLPRALSAVLLPRVAALSAGGAEERTSRDLVEAKSVRHAVLLVGVPSLALAAGVALLVPLVYGREFAPAIGLALILVPGAALLGIANVLMATVVGRGRPGYSLAGALVSTPVTVALYLLVIPPFGARGAAVASTVSYALSFLLSTYFFRRATGVRVTSCLLPTRDELEDYRRIWRAAATARAARRAGAAPRQPTPVPASAGAVPRREPAGALDSPGRRG